jgi:hypothetical protein
MESTRSDLIEKILRCSVLLFQPEATLQIILLYPDLCSKQQQVSHVPLPDSLLEYRRRKIGEIQCICSQLPRHPVVDACVVDCSMGLAATGCGVQVKAQNNVPALKSALAPTSGLLPHGGVR